MYERFTGQARKVVQLAHQEARRLRSDHVGTLHLLLGLLAEGSGGVARLLQELGVEPRPFYRQVRALVPCGHRASTEERLPLTPRAKAVLERAGEQASALGHGRVGPEQLLLGLAAEPEGEAAQLLLVRGLDGERIRGAITGLPPPEDRDTMTQAAESVGLLVPADPAARDLEDLVSPEALPSWTIAETMVQGMKPGRLPTPDERSLIEIRLAGVQSNLEVLDRQLHFTQVALGMTAGMVAGFAAGAVHWAIIGGFIGAAVALVRRMLPSIVAGAVAGCIIALGWTKAPAVTVPLGLMFGAAFGGCLGDWRRAFWRPKAREKLVLRKRDAADGPGE